MAILSVVSHSIWSAGLPLVEALATSWEVQHPPEGGKAVACMLDLAH
jgi:hypothetical protein